MYNGQVVQLISIGAFLLGQQIDVHCRCRFTSQGILIHEQVHCDITGKVVCATENTDQGIEELERKYRKRPVAIGWHECRQLLFEQLPPNTVQFGKQVLWHKNA